ncbi:MAG TPA: aminomethyl-transferring glycine dehydrogenase [Chthoniobacterales bacterium]|jgi:glycine dehydrogenase|nr:aminomethyl-transferring glycine dehydrogenase [Chthoniobacterales bacterium]
MPSAETEKDRVDSFAHRHIGPNKAARAAMLADLGFENLDELIDATVPQNIRLDHPLDLSAAKSESEALEELRNLAKKNIVARSFIGAGYSDTITPPVIQRNILENPGWYTAYTPYQAEIAQGRLEALLNFQTMITDLTALDIANASLLDEGTAAAEAMTLCRASVGNDRTTFFVADNCHPQTIEIVQTRAKPLDIKVIIGDFSSFKFDETVFGALVQYPATGGAIFDYESFSKAAHEAGALLVVAADILALTLLKPPGEFGADVAVGSTQRFGVPLGFGGPHAAYFATRDAYKRHMAGRLVGVSHDATGRPGYRLSMQTREQHIRRDKATSNICTAQVLLAVIASMYAVYHGPRGLRWIGAQVHLRARILAAALEQRGLEIGSAPFFDTITVRAKTKPATEIVDAAIQRQINLRLIDSNTIAISLDETTTIDDLVKIGEVFAVDLDAIVSKYIGETEKNLARLLQSAESSDTTLFFDEADALLGKSTEIKDSHDRYARRSEFLAHPVFNTHHTETEMLRYLRRLESRDLSLTTSMIPLGSCTMKLNATAEMFPISWPEFSKLHPFAPNDQTVGYREMCGQLAKWLAEITGFAAVALQPNAGSQGEYAGLLAIREYHASRGQAARNICLIPTSAHGTNPASAVMAGFKVVPVACLKDGDIDLADLRAKADTHKDDLAALMVTYPSTHGVFETTIREICEIVHSHGGQVYMDGANMNAQVGLCRPGDIGADVCHLNLHKTFCIPHGGGGPGVGPIGVASHLVPFLPTLSSVENRKSKFENAVGPVTSAPYGSASILTISWMYIRMMGGEGLTEATKIAILNANYIAKRLDGYFPVLFKGKRGLVAHECIVDLRQWKGGGVEVEDVAKRLMDYGFHAPTVSFPVAGTMMIEPTESESKEELDRFCEAMILIHGEIQAVVSGSADKKNNVLKNAPHTAQQVTADNWDRPYSRETGAYPAPWTREHKFWPAIGRIDSVYGDRNLFCTCVPMDGLPE